LAFCSECSMRLRPITSRRCPALRPAGPMSGISSKHGLTWGLGHTLTLFVFASAAIIIGHAIPHAGRASAGDPPSASCWWDSARTYYGGYGATGCIFHRHSHGDGTEHIHVHSHVNEKIPHQNSAHMHPHGFSVAHAAGGTDAWHGRLGSASGAHGFESRQSRLWHVLRAVVRRRLNAWNGRLVRRHRGSAGGFRAMG